MMIFRKNSAQPQAIRAGFLLLALFGAAPSFGQMGMSGGSRSLGGYGGSTIGSYYGGGSGLLPYGGKTGVIPGSRSPSSLPVPRRLASTPIGGASSGTLRTRVGMGFENPVGMPMTSPSPMRRGPTGPGLGWPFSVPAPLTGSGSMATP